jgi:hypothetical protein
MCPHKQAFVLSQGIIGDHAGQPKVACPLHKKTFSLENGEEIGDGDLKIITFPVNVVGDDVMVELPAEPELDAILGTNGLRVVKSDCIDIAGDAIKVPSRGAKALGNVWDAGEKLVSESIKKTTTALRATQSNATSTEE